MKYPVTLRSLGMNPRALGLNPRAMRTNPGRQYRPPRPKSPRDHVRADEGIGRRLRFEVMKRDGFRCTYCGRRGGEDVVLQIDHITPRAKGGTDHPTNLTTACRDCNVGKADIPLEERRI